VTNTDIFGVKIPDSRIAREITQLIRDTESGVLFHHSTRVYFISLASTSVVKAAPRLVGQSRGSLCRALLAIRLAIGISHPHLKQTTNIKKKFQGHRWLRDIPRAPALDRQEETHVFSGRLSAKAAEYERSGDQISEGKPQIPQAS